jgi:hypothetical protein
MVEENVWSGAAETWQNSQKSAIEFLRNALN